MNSVNHIKISVRAWSDSVSFKPLAKQLGARTGNVYDKGDPIRGRLVSPDNYLSTEDIRIDGLTNLNQKIRDEVSFITKDPTLSALIRGGRGKVYIWVAVFGNEPRETGTLGIDMRPFGRGIGLIVDNFTTSDEGGNPKLLEIKPDVGS
jgi:hypothetical protein